MGKYSAALFWVAGKASGYLKSVRLGRLTGHGVFLRLLTQDGHVLADLDGVPTYLWWTYTVRPYEPYTTELFKRALFPGATVLDLGAHFGYFSMIAARRVGSNGRVYAFEPAPPNFAILTRALELNGVRNVDAVQKAVSDDALPVPFLLADASTAHGIHGELFKTAKQVIQVDCVTIDEFIEKDQAVHVVKMDIQGHEVQALRGMVQTIARSSQLEMFVEWSPGLLRYAGVDPRQPVHMLRDLGFEVCMIDEQNRQLLPIQTDPLSVPDDPLWYGNLYCRKGARW
jgi:FkbM family methyltransferase